MSHNYVCGSTHFSNLTIFIFGTLNGKGVGRNLHSFRYIGQSLDFIDVRIRIVDELRF